MSHFKFVSTINAAEEGCTHFLVWGTEGWGWDIASLRRASTSNHRPVVPATEAEVLPTWPERVGAGRQSLPWVQLSDGLWDPRISNPSRSGSGWERKGGAGRAAFPTGIHLHQGGSGTKCCKHPSHDSCHRPQPTLKTATGRWGQEGSKGLGWPRVLQRGSGTWVGPCSSGAPHWGDVLVTDTSVLCSSVCRKWSCKLLIEMLPSRHPLCATEMKICFLKKSFYLYWKL